MISGVAAWIIGVSNAYLGVGRRVSLSGEKPETHDKYNPRLLRSLKVARLQRSIGEVNLFTEPSNRRRQQASDMNEVDPKGSD
jgi:hypothetical protein